PRRSPHGRGGSARGRHRGHRGAHREPRAGRRGAGRGARVGDGADARRGRGLRVRRPRRTRAQGCVRLVAPVRGEVSMMQFGAPLPLMDFGGNTYDGATLRAYARLAADLGFSALAANDHMVFDVPWLDGPTALAPVIESSQPMPLATPVALPVVRGPVAFAKQIAALDRLSGGRMRVAVGPGSSARDYDVVGLDFEERWKRLDEVIPALRSLWEPD